MADIIEKSDLPIALQSLELIDLMIAAANAAASRVAPCLAWDGSDADHPAPTAGQLAEAQLVLIGVIQRWADAGSGAYTQQTAGPFSVSTDNRQPSGYRLWPSNISDLQAICSTGSVGREAFSFDTAPACSAHLPWCSLSMGAAYCSCGVDIAGYPIYELD